MWKCENVKMWECGNDDSSTSVQVSDTRMLSLAQVLVNKK